jgi:HD-GYP domain-containing protein (c-di-GMP phosphodiesterase class II)
MAMYASKARQKRVQLIESLTEGDLEQTEQIDKVVGSLCNMLYRKAPYYPGHARRVTCLSVMIARRLWSDRGGNRDAGPCRPPA